MKNKKYHYRIATYQHSNDNHEELISCDNYDTLDYDNEDAALDDMYRNIIRKIYYLMNKAVCDQLLDPLRLNIVNYMYEFGDAYIRYKNKNKILDDIIYNIHGSIIYYYDETHIKYRDHTITFSNNTLYVVNSKGYVVNTVIPSDIDESLNTIFKDIDKKLY